MTSIDRPEREPKAARRYAVIGVVMALSLAMFFRDALASGLTLTYGDSYDGLIEIAILQHWHNVVAHGAVWNVADYFYPHPDTLGYNDTYIIPGVFYAIARLAGADPFVGAFVSHVAMRAIGFLGMYALLRRGLTVGFALSLAGAALFTTANAALLHIYHAQTLSVGLLPWLALGVIAMVRAVRAGDPRSLRRYGVAFAILFGLSALNAFYGIWFFTLFTIVAVIVAFLLETCDEKAAWIGAIRRQWASLLLVAAATLAALLPFAAVYVPKLAEGAKHSWREGAHLYLPDLTTLFNTGPGNLVWGPVFRAIIPVGQQLPRGEDTVGFPLGLMMALLLAILWAAKDRAERKAALVLGLTLAIVLAAMLRWPGDISAWKLVYDIVPGADAVRVVSRFPLFALAAVIPVVMVFLDRAPRPGWLTVAIVALLLVEQVQLQSPLSLDRAEQKAMLATVGPPPTGCDSFFVIAARTDDAAAQAEARRVATAWGGQDSGADQMRQFYRHNVDAMLIAAYYRVPTINGFSSFNPPDWQFAYPRDPSYAVRVSRYIAAHGLKNVCGLDRTRSPQWFRVSRGAAPPAD